jgi:hypothetical protein
MSFEVRPIKGDKWELVLTDEPGYIHALKMAPDSMEPELKSGVWLIVVFPVWSGPVRHSVRAAVASAKAHGGKFQLGVRPSDYHEELYKWWPGGEAPAGGDNLLMAQDESRRAVHISTDPSSSPVWLVLRDGQGVHQGAGPRSKEQLSELMQAALV